MWISTPDPCMNTPPTVKQVEDAVAAGYDNFLKATIWATIPDSADPELPWVYDLKTKTANSNQYDVSVMMVCVKSK